jgi:hypothetical protein
MNQIQAFLLAAACGVSMTAAAQWQWLDKDGHKVFSDRAPPPEVLEKDILKRPAPRIPASAPASQLEAGVPKVSGVDKDLMEKRKKADEAEANRRKAEQDKFLLAKVENCKRARQVKTRYESGQPIAHTNEKGERELLDAAGRATEIKRLDAIIESDCN